MSTTSVLIQARSCLAALADGAKRLDAASAYEQTLIELDRLYADDLPALDTTSLPADRTVLYVSAASSIEELVEHGADALQIELILARLEDARQLDDLGARDGS
ncbi:hypothetical protein KVF89_25635 [Nocardioides carbamazepini]|uniref:hypothetical protein n=1 Tax=Nocardioides carbamazepini TaxID=2854259 RepID=UPI00214A75C0|nr:hypothetical protein [Nocardioides carbamazepini]MCR1785943.1 hypothetical protein [Nocardioides carbamazepini]